MTKKTSNQSKKVKNQKTPQDKTEALKDKLKKKDAQIKLFKKETQELMEQNLRKIADMENLKKRLAREKAEFYQYALSDFLRELFTVLDNFERALMSADQGDGKSFREGVEMICKQYQDLLIKYGAKPIEVKGKKFDPHLHQAFITVESADVKEPEILEEMQKGYTLHNRLLRPSIVKVAVPKKSKK
jgi:molecular chaperone GrpE